MFAYDAAHLLARRFLERGDSVMLECTYARREQRASLIEALGDTSAPLWVVEFFVTPDEAVRRFRERHQDTDLDDELVRERAGSFPYSDQAFCVASSPAEPERDAQDVCDWLERRPRSSVYDPWTQAGRDW